MVHDLFQSDPFFEQSRTEHGAIAAASTQCVPAAAVVVRAVPFSAEEARELAAAFIDLDLDP